MSPRESNSFDVLQIGAINVPSPARPPLPLPTLGPFPLTSPPQVLTGLGVGWKGRGARDTGEGGPKGRRGTERQGFGSRRGGEGRGKRAEGEEREQLAGRGKREKRGVTIRLGCLPKKGEGTLREGSKERK